MRYIDGFTSALISVPSRESIYNSLKVTESTIELTFDPSYNPNIVCGICDRSANDHNALEWLTDPLTGQSLPSCFRTPEEVGSTDERYEVNDLGHYSPTDHLNGIPVTSYVGSTEVDTSLEDRWHVAYDSAADQDAVDNYRDQNSDEFTSAGPVTITKRNGQVTHQKALQTSTERFADNATRNVFVDGTDGFMTVEVYNPTVTANYQAKLLNVFKNKRGHLQVGGVQFTPVVSFQKDQPVPYHPMVKTIEARCVQNDCSAVMVAPAHQGLTRDAMEAFTYACIRHGNNHAAKWFTSRSTFYKVHEDNCDLTCDAKAIKCNPVALTAEDVLAQTMCGIAA